MVLNLVGWREYLTSNPRATGESLPFIEKQSCHTVNFIMWNFPRAPLALQRIISNATQPRSRSLGRAQTCRARNRARKACRVQFSRDAAHLTAPSPCKLGARTVWPLSRQRNRYRSCRPLAGVRLAGASRAPTRRRWYSAGALRKQIASKSVCARLCATFPPSLRVEGFPFARARWSVYAISHPIGLTHTRVRRPLRPRRWVITPLSF